MNYDVIIIGGSFAGLASALYLARSRKSVCIIDAGLPRNRFAAESHGILGQDGQNPQTILATARAQIAAYPTVKFVQGKATEAKKLDQGFSVKFENGEQLHSSKLLLAYGVSDILPKIKGLADQWGKSVLHCPYCHGYEYSDKKLGVLNTSPMSIHQAMLITQWGPTTYFLNGGEMPENSILEQFKLRGITIEPTPVKALISENKHLTQIDLAGGHSQMIDALFILPANVCNSQMAQQLGCEIEQGPMGSMIKVDEMKMTTVVDVYAAGDITRGAHTVTFAMADGVMAALAMHRSLVFGVPNEGEK